MVQARRYLVEGLVQGVGFRFFVERIARQLQLAGYVKNLDDGRVEVFAMGPAEQLEELKRRLEQGPRAARVERVREEEATAQDRYGSGFTVEFGGGWS
jgi:acylphosphatase